MYIFDCNIDLNKCISYDTWIASLHRVLYVSTDHLPNTPLQKENQVTNKGTEPQIYIKENQKHLKFVQSEEA